MFPDTADSHVSLLQPPTVWPAGPGWITDVFMYIYLFRMHKRIAAKRVVETDGSAVARDAKTTRRRT